MKKLLLFLLRKLGSTAGGMVALWLMLLAPGIAVAQCPPVALCQPGNAPASNLLFGMGIFRVTMAGLDTVTNGAADGYQDYSCRARAAQLVRGGTHTLTVQTNSAVDEIVRAWIDFDRDGTFGAGELILTSGAGRVHTASFTVPISVASSQPLRIRIAADYSNAPVPSACSTPVYSQTEDYRAIVLPATIPRPQARFLAIDTVSCGGTIAFQDQSSNSPTSWRWTFGDGTVATQQRPQHAYSQPGRYTVRLRVCNAGGCDSLTKTNYITVFGDAPLAAPCQPTTTGYCCNFGLARVQGAGIDHVSGNGSAGYEDFSCAHRGVVTADQPTSFQLTTGSNPQDVRLYLDLNNNGQFDLPSEVLYEGLAVQNPTAIVQVGLVSGLVYNRPLRLRLWVDAAGTSPYGPCISPQVGQVEDYTITVVPNTAPPTARFLLVYQQLCQPVRISLANTTTGAPTNYEWDFGDGSSSTAGTPLPHVYTTPGRYEVQLIARNANGADTVRQVVAVSSCPTTYCTANGLGGTSTSPASFTRIQLGGIDNVSARTFGTGYYDFTSVYTELQAGQLYTLRAESQPWQFAGAGPWAQVAVWIDYNQDGQFGANELVGARTSFSPHLLSFRIPANAKFGATRLRVLIQSQATPLSDDSCTPTGRNASTEDYTLLIVPAPVAPTAGLQADLTTSCSGLVQFHDTSWAGPTRWLWTFGDGTTSALQHPLHRYAAVGTYSVSLQVSSRYGSSRVTKANYVTVTGLTTGPHPAACLPLRGSTGYYWGIGQLAIGSSFAYSQPPGATGYQDLTCALPPIQLASGSSAAVSFTAVRVAGTNPSSTYNVRMWLDANDDGVFAPAGELVYQSGPAGVTQTGLLTLPPTIVLGRPLRLRVQYANGDATPVMTGLADPCYRHDSMGQVRDFALVVASSPTAVYSAASPVKWRVFPNPSTGTVQVQGQFSGLVAVEIHNALGQRVWQEVVNTPATGLFSLDLHRLPPGMYLMRLNQQLVSTHLVIE